MSSTKRRWWSSPTIWLLWATIQCRLKSVVMVVWSVITSAAHAKLAVQTWRRGPTKDIVRSFRYSQVHADLLVMYWPPTQLGELQTPEDTRAQIEHQIQLLRLSGGTDKVKTTISQSGVWDSATTGVVGHILELGKVLQKRTAGKPMLLEAEVTVQLEKELDALLSSRSLNDHINPLLRMQG